MNEAMQKIRSSATETAKIVPQFMPLKIIDRTNDFSLAFAHCDTYS